MPSLSLAVDHALSQEEAMDRIKRLVEIAKAQYQSHVSELREEWSDSAVEFAFSAMGFSTSGTMHVEATQVRIESKIPLAAVIFRGRIEDALRGQLTRILRS